MLSLNSLFFPKPSPPGYDDKLEYLKYLEVP